MLVAVVSSSKCCRRASKQQWLQGYWLDAVRHQPERIQSLTVMSFNYRRLLALLQQLVWSSIRTGHTGRIGCAYTWTRRSSVEA